MKQNQLVKNQVKNKQKTKNCAIVNSADVQIQNLVVQYSTRPYLNGIYVLYLNN